MGLGGRHGIDRVPTRLERWLGRRALAVAERLHRLPYAPLNYDSERSPAPRWGHGRPSHPGLRELLARHDDACRAALERVVAQREALARIPRERGAPGEPFW